MSIDPKESAEHISASHSEGTLVQSPSEQALAAAASSVRIEIPGYEIECELGRGGMGIVFRAKQSGLNRYVALKMVISGPYADPSTRARFLLEAESVAAMEHPNVVKVYAFGEHGGHPFLAMEYLPAGSIADRLKKCGPIPHAEAAELMAKLASAVAHAHSRGVVHRDIKPANVLLTGDGEPRLADFGLAKVGRGDLSVTGQVLGTPAYMAPEQAAGKVHQIGTSADIYALGAVMYDLLTGHPPFRGDSLAATLQRVLSEEPQPLRKLNRHIPRELEAVCLKCLQKDPIDRYHTAQDVADDLGRVLRGESILAQAPGLLDWLQQLMRKQPSPMIEYSSLVLVLYGIIWLILHASIFLLVYTGGAAVWVWVTTASSSIAVFGIMWWHMLRRFRILPMAERHMLILAFGSILAYLALTLSFVPPPLDHPAHRTLHMYPSLSALAGLGIFTLGSIYWSRFLVLGIVMMMLSPLCAWWPFFAPLVNGISIALFFFYWSYVVAILHLRRSRPAVHSVKQT